MDNKVLTAIIAGVLLLCGTAIGITALLVSGGDGAPAEPTTTSAPSTPEPVETSDPLRDLLEDIWNDQSAADQESMCWLFDLDPDKAFNVFDDGSEGLLPEETFMDFFEEQC